MHHWVAPGGRGGRGANWQRSGCIRFARLSVFQFSSVNSFHVLQVPGRHSRAAMCSTGNEDKAAGGWGRLGSAEGEEYWAGDTGSERAPLLPSRLARPEGPPGPSPLPPGILLRPASDPVCGNRGALNSPLSL